MCVVMGTVDTVFSPGDEQYGVRAAGARRWGCLIASDVSARDHRMGRRERGTGCSRMSRSKQAPHRHAHAPDVCCGRAHGPESARQAASLPRTAAVPEHKAILVIQDGADCNLSSAADAHRRPPARPHRRRRRARPARPDCASFPGRSSERPPETRPEEDGRGGQERFLRPPRRRQPCAAETQPSPGRSPCTPGPARSPARAALHVCARGPQLCLRARRRRRGWRRPSR
jgi:hypothetical protein